MLFRMLFRYPVETHGVRLSMPDGKVVYCLFIGLILRRCAPLCWICTEETCTSLLDLHRGDARRASLQVIPFSAEGIRKKCLTDHV